MNFDLEKLREGVRALDVEEQTLLGEFVGCMVGGLVAQAAAVFVELPDGDEKLAKLAPVIEKLKKACGVP